MSNGLKTFSFIIVVVLALAILIAFCNNIVNNKLYSAERYHYIEILPETTELNLVRGVVYEIKILPSVEKNNLYITNKPHYSKFFKNDNDEYIMILYSGGYPDTEIISINTFDKSNNQKIQEIYLTLK